MKWKAMWIGVAVLFSALAIPSNAAKPVKSFDLWLTAEVEIAADGRVNTVKWLDERPAARLVTARIEPRVRAWQFEPGAIDGVPQVTRTFLKTQILVEPNGADMALRIGRVTTGPRALHMVAPRYPESAARAGISAMVTAVLRVEPDGTVAFESLDYFRPGKRTASREEFVEATRAALAQWKYTPERVGEHDVPVQVRIPVEFCAPGANCAKLFRTGNKDGSAVAEAHDRPGEAIALNSPVRLLTAVEGESI